MTAVDLAIQPVAYAVRLEGADHDRDTESPRLRPRTEETSHSSAQPSPKVRSYSISTGTMTYDAPYIIQNCIEARGTSVLLLAQGQSFSELR